MVPSHGGPIASAETEPIIRRPVVLLAFANDREEGGRYLRNLSEEARQLRARFEAVDPAIDLEVRQNATLNDVMEVFGKHRHQIAVFHFGGHAGSYELLLESSAGSPQVTHAPGLAEFLGSHHGLHLVFLNGCSTRAQVESLMRAGVPAVIATDRSIDDAVAVEFANEFYRALLSGVALQNAFELAVASTRAARGDDPRGVCRPLGPTGAEQSAWPWGLYTSSSGSDSNEWTIGDAVENPLFGLPPVQHRDLPPVPFRHLHPYEPEHVAVFFGRDPEIRELYRSVTEGEAPVLLVYGQRAVGKTSLIRSGLVPRLSLDRLVRYTQWSAGADPLEGFAGSLGCQSDPAAIRSAWRDLESADRPLDIVVDQLGEDFVRSITDGDDGVGPLGALLQELFLDPQSRPNGKLILVLQKEWLAEVDAAIRTCGIPRALHFIERLNRAGIVSAITGIAKTPRLAAHFGLIVDKDLPQMMADDLMEDELAAVTPTLQILLTKMWSSATQLAPATPAFTVDLYRSLKRDGLLLNDFIDAQLRLLGEWDARPLNSGLAIDVLAYHTTTSGSSLSRSRSELERTYLPPQSGHATWRGSVGDWLRSAALMGVAGARRNRKQREEKREMVPQLVSRLVDVHLLAHVDGTASNGTKLAHDVLAPLIRKKYAASEARGQRARRLLENPRGREAYKRRWLWIPFIVPAVDSPFGGWFLLAAPVWRRLLRVIDREPSQESDQRTSDSSVESHLPKRAIHPADLLLIDEGAIGTREWTAAEADELRKSRRQWAKSKWFPRLVYVMAVLALNSFLISWGRAQQSTSQWASAVLAYAARDIAQEDQEAGILLAVEAIRTYETPQAVLALLQALQRHRQVQWFSEPGTGTNPVYAAVLADTSLAFWREHAPGDSAYFELVFQTPPTELRWRTLRIAPCAGVQCDSVSLHVSQNLSSYDPEFEVFLGQTEPPDSLALLRLPATGEERVVAFGADGVRLWNLGIESLLETACESVHISSMPDTIWDKYIRDRNWERTCN